MTMSRRSHGTPAPYGKSCETCSRAKCKCILRPEGGACDRCYRLKKNCHPSETRRGHRTASRHESSETSRIDEAVGRTVQLEARFNQLVASLQPATQRHGSTTNLESSSMTPLSSISSTAANSANPQGDNQTITEPLSLSDHVLTAANIETRQAESLLMDFKSNYLKWFPFIYLPDTMTSKQLCLDRPMLWLAIMVTCHPLQKEKQRLDNLYRRTIADEMVVNARKSIDLLLSLLCFVGWYHNHCLRENGTMRLSLSLLQQMAISLVYDLRKPNSVFPTQVLNSALHRSTGCGGEGGYYQDAARTNEERRAFIACFCLTSTIAAYIPRIEPIRWAGYLNDCLRALESSPECLNDEVLVHYVHLQLIFERTALLRWYEDFMDTAEHQVPPSFYDFTLRQRIHQVRDRIPVHLRDNEVLRLQCSSVELSINELPMAEISITQKSPPQSSFRSRKLAYSCINSIRSWFEVFLSLPATTFLGQSFSLGVQSLRCLGIVFYLSKIFKETGEDIEFAPEVEPLRLLDCILDRTQSTITATGVGEDSYLFRFHEAFRQLRHQWAVEYAANVEIVPGDQLPTETSTAQHGTSTLLGGNATLTNRRDDTDFVDFPEFDLFDTSFVLGWQPMNGF